MSWKHLPLSAVSKWAISLFFLSVSLAEAKSNALENDVVGAVQKVDELVMKRWHDLGLNPAPLTTDEEFLRRVFLDTVGTIPPVEHWDPLLTVSGFVASPNAEKRRLVIEKLLAHPAFINNWVTTWENIILGRGMGRVNRASLRSWLWMQLSQKIPYNKFVESLITANGTSEENGAVAFFSQFNGKPEDMTNAVAQTFLGVRVQCCQCHDHKYERDLKQEDFWSFAAYFAKTRVRRVRVPGMGQKLEYMVVRDVGGGSVRMPKRNKDAQIERVLIDPKYKIFDPAGDPNPKGDGQELRRQLAQNVTSVDNPFFAKSYANRIWHQLFGRGLVEPFNDFRPSNPPSVPEALDFLADDFIGHNFDMKRPIRVILNTKTYQRSSRGPEVDANDNIYFIKARLRPMTPEQLFSSVVQACQPVDIKQMNQRGEVERMMQNFRRKFVRNFETEEVAEVVDFEGSILQALEMLNGTLINSNIEATPQRLLGRFVASPTPDVRKLEHLFLRFLSRYPSAEERRLFIAPILQAGQQARKNLGVEFAKLRRKGKRAVLDEQKIAAVYAPYRQVYEDLLWAMLNSSEFVFNH